MLRLRRSVWMLAALALATPAAAILASCSRRSGPDETLEAPDAGGSPAAIEPAARRVYHSPLAGRWYEADPEALRRKIQKYLDAANGERLSDLCALVLPHAGYDYSGPTAAFGVKQLVGRKYRRVVVMGPTHRLPMENVASVPDATDYATPLGEIPLDRRFLAELRKHSEFISNPRAHDGEHSVQIELPLLQQTLGSFQLVPIVVGQLDLPTTRKIARILLGLLDDQTLVVASSDFTHYGRNFDYYPFRENVGENLKKLDMGAVDRIREKDVAGFFDYVAQTGATICGRYDIGVLLAMLPAEAQLHLLHYDTSGRITGDFTSSVSYVSLAFTGKWPRAAPLPADADADRFTLSEEDRAQLLKLARATLSFALTERKFPTAEDLNAPLTPGMKRVAGAFVTLHEKGSLRGCVGEIFPARPLYKAVMAQAVNAGLNDHRFPPVEQSELPQLDFEISVLTPPHPIGSYKNIVLGKNGIVLEKGGRSAVYLPQVAPEQKWSLEETLTHLSRKAGLPEDAWRNGASFTVFEAIVFSEDDE